jgi:hypothetical protein
MPENSCDQINQNEHKAKLKMYLETIQKKYITSNLFFSKASFKAQLEVFLLTKQNFQNHYRFNAFIFIVVSETSGVDLIKSF